MIFSDSVSVSSASALDIPFVWFCVAALLFSNYLEVMMSAMFEFLLVPTVSTQHAGSLAEGWHRYTGLWTLTAAHCLNQASLILHLRGLNKP